MMTARSLAAPQALWAALALGVAAAPAAQAQTAPAQTAQADAEKAAPAAPGVRADPKASGVEGVTVKAPRARPDLARIPPDKAAGFADEAAKNQAWKDYRRSTPDSGVDPNALSKDFPGLQAYVPPQ